MTTTQTMSIHRALSELKTLNDRIPKAIQEADFIATDRKSAQKINGFTAKLIISCNYCTVTRFFLGRFFDLCRMERNVFRKAANK